jgi:hypothetical protein
MPHVSLRQRLLPVVALLRLAQVHRAIRRRRFDQLFALQITPRPRRPRPRLDPAIAHAAVERACSWYLRRSNCLHRSAVLTMLLRGVGFDAHMIWGIRREPYAGHVWVELDGVVINDDQAVATEYTPVHRG